MKKFNRQKEKFAHLLDSVNLKELGADKGVNMNRTRTDPVFCYILAVICVIFLGVSIYIAAASDLNKLLAPIDSSGKFCGIDEMKGYRLSLDYEGASTCVKKCPKDGENLEYKDKDGEGSVKMEGISFTRRSRKCKKEKKR